MNTMLRYLDTQLKASAYLVGNTISIADLQLAVSLINCYRY